MIRNGAGARRVRPAAARSERDDRADWALTRLWLQACITGDEAAKEELFFAQGRGMAGMYAYELFLARRTVEQERARGGGEGHEAAIGGAAGRSPAGARAGGGAG